MALFQANLKIAGSCRCLVPYVYMLVEKKLPVSA